MKVDKPFPWDAQTPDSYQCQQLREILYLGQKDQSLLSLLIGHIIT